MVSKYVEIKRNLAHIIEYNLQNPNDILLTTIVNKLKCKESISSSACHQKCHV